MSVKHRINQFLSDMTDLEEALSNSGKELGETEYNQLRQLFTDLRSLLPKILTKLEIEEDVDVKFENLVFTPDSPFCCFEADNHSEEELPNFPVEPTPTLNASKPKRRRSQRKQNLNPSKNDSKEPYSCSKNLPAYKSDEYHSHSELDFDITDEEDENPSLKSKLKKKQKQLQTPKKKAFTMEQMKLNQKVKNFLSQDFPNLLKSLFKCPFCEKEYNVKDRLREHLASHIQGEFVACPGCAIMVKPGSLKAHVRRSHPDRITEFLGDRKSKKKYKPDEFGFKKEDIENPSNPQKPYKCPVCGKPVERKSQAILHAETHKPESLLQLCPICGKSFKHLEFHVKTAHPESVHPPQAIEIDLNCPHPSCSKMFGSLVQLKIHLRGAHRSADVTSEKTLEISEFIRRREEIMGTAREKSTSKARIQQNFGKIHQCTGCERKFHSKQRLREHAWIHDESLMFPCSYPGCEKKFGRKSTLKSHWKSHEKRSSCRVQST